MSNLLRPVGPLPPKIYWVRRLIFLALVVGIVVVVGIVLGKLLGGNNDASKSGQAAAATSSPKPEKKPGTPQQCGADGLKLTLAADRFAYSGGQTPRFTVEVSSRGEDPCLVDVNDKSLAVNVTSGNDKIWSSSNCTKADANLLLMRPQDKETVTKTWDLTRTPEKCSGSGTPAKPGTYKVQASLDGAKSKEVVFTLN